MAHRSVYYASRKVVSIVARNKKPERWRVKLVANVIRQVRGKPLLEALFNLQGGLCAYDRQPCLLLLHPSDEFIALGLDLSKELKGRCATIDHVTPRSKGGSNNIDNYVMSSQIRNCEKSDQMPLDEWSPGARRWPVSVIEREIIRVEQARWKEAESLAANVSTVNDAKNVVVQRELERLYADENIEIYKASVNNNVADEQEQEADGQEKVKTRRKRPHRRRRYSTSYRPRPHIRDRV